MTSTDYRSVTTGGCTGTVPVAASRYRCADSPATCTGTDRDCAGTGTAGTGTAGGTGTGTVMRDQTGTAPSTGTGTTRDQQFRTGTDRNSQPVLAELPVPVGTGRTRKGTPMTLEVRAVSITAANYPALFTAISQWSETQPASVAVLSVTVVPVPDRNSFAALVAVTERGDSVCEVPVQAVQLSQRRARDLVAEYYWAAIVTGGDVSATKAAQYAMAEGTPCSRQAAAKVIKKLRAQPPRPYRPEIEAYVQRCIAAGTPLGDITGTATQ